MSKQKKIPVDRVNQERLNGHAHPRYIHTGGQIVNRSGKPVVADGKDGQSTLGGRRFMRRAYGMTGRELRSMMKSRSRETDL